MFETTTHQTSRSSEQGTAWSVCTNPGCFAEREVPAVKHTINQLGQDGVFKRIPVVATSHLEAVNEDGSTDDSVFTCQSCEGPAILSEKPRREVPSYGYAHPLTKAWQAQREQNRA